ncbi:MAG TPA: hypothetical protein VFX76_17885 [Roseiflexaceae bacterium]|nr:hypothetical protein [Roseiflexaceae bacterium]
MNHKNHQTPADAFFDRLLSRSDPHAPPRDERLAQAQVLCGRWLALRRMRLGVSLETLAEHTGWLEETLLFVEVGLAGHDEAVPVSDCLVRLLAGPFGDDAWVAMVLAIALGRVCTPSDQVMRRVAADLDAVCEPEHPPTTISG